MKLLNYVLGLAVTMALTACGGGGGNPGTGPLPPASGTNLPNTPVVSSFVFSLDKSTISNAGGDKAVLTVTALDAARNVMSDVPVSVSVDSGTYTPVTKVTDASGQVTGNISIGSDKSNRTIAATIGVAGLSTGAASVAVVGSQISLTAVPATPSPGASVQVAVKATDANGAGIVGAKVQLGGTLGFTQLVSTDTSGNATATLGAAPNAVGTYTVTAVGLGVNASRDIQVVGAGGGIPDAVGVISSASLAITPNTISPNTVGGTTNRTVLRAVFQNASNQAIQNVRVRFEIVPPGLGSGEQISTGTNVVYSDVSGVAVADYIAGTRSSPTNGVTIRACYGNTDADIAGACTALNSVTTTMTVAGQPLSITLGDNNELEKGGNNLTYIKKFDVAVADAAGNAVANAIVSASVDITHYGKGQYLFGPTAGNYQVTGFTPPNFLTTGTSTQPDPNDNTKTIQREPTLLNGRVWCPNEDTNRNGFLDAAEILAGDGNDILSPRKADVILSFLGTNTTGINGRATIQVEYPQNVATWLAYSVRVTTNVAGSEGTVVKSYVTTFIIGDDTNGSFLTPPYGVNNCKTLN